MHPPTASKEHVKDVHGRRKAAPAAATPAAPLLDGLLTPPVVHLSLLAVRQNFVCLRDLLELQNTHTETNVYL